MLSTNWLLVVLTHSMTCVCCSRVYRHKNKQKMRKYSKLWFTSLLCYCWLVHEKRYIEILLFDIARTMRYISRTDTQLYCSICACVFVFVCLKDIKHFCSWLLSKWGFCHFFMTLGNCYLRIARNIIVVLISMYLHAGLAMGEGTSHLLDMRSCRKKRLHKIL